MTLTILGIAVFLIVSSWFGISYVKASVFLKPGFVNDEIPLGKVKLKQHYHFTFSGDKNNDGR